MANLVITENLKVVMKDVTVRESFQTGDIEVLEMGTAIRAPAWQDQGLITDFGTITTKNRRVPCPWRKVREITATWAMASGGTEAALIGDDDQVYILILDHVPVDPNCPANYWWMGTQDPKTRVVRQVGENQEEQFLDLQEDKESPAIDANLKLSYAFYQLGRMIELKKKGKLLDHLVVSSDPEMGGTVKDAKARQVMVIRETK